MAEQVQSECHPRGGKTVLSPLRGSEMGDALLAGVSLRYTPACTLVTPFGVCVFASDILPRHKPRRGGETTGRGGM